MKPWRDPHVVLIAGAAGRLCQSCSLLGDHHNRRCKTFLLLAKPSTELGADQPVKSMIWAPMVPCYLRAISKGGNSRVGFETRGNVTSPNHLSDTLWNRWDRLQAQTCSPCVTPQQHGVREHMQLKVLPWLSGSTRPEGCASLQEGKLSPPAAGDAGLFLLRERMNT